MTVVFEEGHLLAAVWAELEPPLLAPVPRVVLFRGAGVV